MFTTDAETPHADPDAEPAPVRVPYDQLEAATLTALIESFVTREGTDYGEREVLHETKIEQVRRQLVKGEAVIVFDPGSESIDIVLTRRH